MIQPEIRVEQVLNFTLLENETWIPNTSEYLIKNIFRTRIVITDTVSNQCDSIEEIILLISMIILSTSL